MTVDKVSKEIRALLEMKINECAPAKELPPKQLQFVNDYLVKVLNVEKGINSSFEEFALSIEKLKSLILPRLSLGSALFLNQSYLMKRGF